MCSERGERRMHGYGLIIAISIVVLLAIGYILYNFRYFKSIKHEVDNIQKEISDTKDIETIENKLIEAGMRITISSASRFHNPTKQFTLDNVGISAFQRDVYLWKGQKLIAVNGISLLKEAGVDDFRLIRMILDNLDLIERHLDRFPYSPQQEF